MAEFLRDDLAGISIIKPCGSKPFWKLGYWPYHLSKPPVFSANKMSLCRQGSLYRWALSPCQLKVSSLCVEVAQSMVFMEPGCIGLVFIPFELLRVREVSRD